jgi:glutamate 5-kinase
MSGLLVGAKRIVVKVGSSLVTDEGRGVDARAIGDWCRQLAALRHLGVESVVVSSGAIAEGMKRLGWAQRPRELHALQAAAAVGQMGLAQMYETHLRAHALASAQVLLTHADLSHRERYLNARSTLTTLLVHGVLPVINENDTVVNDEIKFGDNDTLGALVTNLLDADALVILTDQQGLYTANPRTDASASLVREAASDDPALPAMAGGAGSAIGRGGMLTKVLAAQRAARSGAHTVIAYGREPDVLIRLLNGEAIGSALRAPQAKRTARKQWMADHLQLAGRVRVDAGAARALCEQGRSLLPVGVREVLGDFHRGDVIAVVDAQGRELARGLSNYASAEARLLAGRASADIEQVLGYVAEAELIHRDNLVLS